MYVNKSKVGSIRTKELVRIEHVQKMDDNIVPKKFINVESVKK